MASIPDHGRRLSPEEYDLAVTSLYDRDVNGGQGGADDLWLRRAELNLTIDYRLGVDFPQDRREAMWRIQQEIEERRIRLLARSVVAYFFPWRRAARVNRLVEVMKCKYARVLTPAELRAFLPSVYEQAN